MRALHKTESDASRQADPCPIQDSLPTSELVLLVHGQMRLLAGPQPDLEDLVQTALEQLLVSEYQGKAQPSTFTHAVCYRVWMKHLRWRYRFFARISLTTDGVLPELADSDNSYEQFERRERYGRLYAALDKLPPKMRAVVSLHDIGGLEVEEIAEIVEAKLGTVRSRLRDGRKRLGGLLHNDAYFGDEACEKALR